MELEELLMISATILYSNNTAASYTRKDAVEDALAMWRTVVHRDKRNE